MSIFRMMWDRISARAGSMSGLGSAVMIRSWSAWRSYISSASGRERPEVVRKEVADIPHSVARRRTTDEWDIPWITLWKRQFKTR